jgi:hypothetical protein
MSNGVAHTTYTVFAQRESDQQTTETQCATPDEALTHTSGGRELVLNEIADPHGATYERYGLHCDHTGVVDEPCAP